MKSSEVLAAEAAIMAAIGVPMADGPMMHVTTADTMTLPTAGAIPMANVPTDDTMTSDTTKLPTSVAPMAIGAHADEEAAAPADDGPSAPPPPPPDNWKWPRESEKIEIEVDEGDGATEWMPAIVTAVLIDGWFRARMLHDEEWEDWFTWQEEDVDWRRVAVTTSTNKRKAPGGGGGEGSGKAASKEHVTKEGADEPADGSVRKRLDRCCGACKSCRRADDCGHCKACLDKPKFGGGNKLKQRCEKRRCLTPKPLEASGPNSVRKSSVPAIIAKAKFPPLAPAGSAMAGAMTTSAAGGPASMVVAASKPPVPLGPPAFTAPACVLPCSFTVAAREAGRPPWGPGEGRGPRTKSMILARSGRGRSNGSGQNGSDDAAAA